MYRERDGLEGKCQGHDEENKDHHEPGNVDDDLSHNADQGRDLRNQPQKVETFEEHHNDE